MYYNYYNNLCKVFFFILLFISLSAFFSALYLFSVDFVYLVDWNIININSSLLTFSMLFDNKSMMFISFVTFISSMVVMYSNMYMYGDENLFRFIMLVMLFVLSMIFLIISPNLISILLGWDGLGLVSYCLVIYYQNEKSYNAGMLTALSNRIGDVLLLMSIFVLLMWGDWDFYLINMYKLNELYYVVMMIIVASMTKSAQIPFSSWLPAAMAAPTPVSALVHSSTLVTAGVYLLIRFYNLISYYMLNDYLLYIGCLTMFMSGLGANYEFDLKKIIALSTLSQLGLMMSTIGLGYCDLAFFHLLTHAVFKALLFLCAGLMIHNMNNLQDIRGMGGLINQMPLTSLCFLISNMSLCGLPFFSGFYSKDLILEVSLMSNLNLIIFFFFFFSTGLTVCYTMRLIYYTMLTDFNFFSFHSLGDEDSEFILPMLTLMFMAVVSGSMLMWMMIDTPMVVYLSFTMKFMPLLVSFIGGWFGLELFNMISFFNINFKNYMLVEFLGSMWFMPYISTYLMIFNPLNQGYKIMRILDTGWTESLGSQGLYAMLINLSNMNYFMEVNMLKLIILNFMIYLVMIVVMLFIYF